MNAIYLKAPWAEEFAASATQPRPFYALGGAARDVPTMVRQAQFGYGRRDRFSVVTVPYSGGEQNDQECRQGSQGQYSLRCRTISAHSALAGASRSVVSPRI